MSSRYSGLVKVKERVENEGYLLESEIPLLISHIKKPKLKLLTFVLCYSGRRISEALLLKPMHILQDDNMISWTILKKKKEKNVVKKKKCYPNLINVLLSYLSKVSVRFNDYIFQSSRSSDGKKHYTRQHVWSIIHKAGKEMGKDIHPHTLRHTFGVMLAMKQAPFKVIQNQLDHSDPMTTQIYLDIAQVHVQDFFNKQESPKLDLFGSIPKVSKHKEENEDFGDLLNNMFNVKKEEVKNEMQIEIPEL